MPAGLSVRARIVASLVVIASGQLMLTGLDTGTSAPDLLPGLLVAGVGSGANNTARYVGAALGTTIVAVIAAHADRAALIAGWDTAAVVTAALSVAGALLVAVTGVKVRVSVKA